VPHKVRGKLLAGDPRHKTRWADPVEKELAGRAILDLQMNFNRITLVPAPHQNHGAHKIRVQETENPKWYRKFVDGRWNRDGCQVRRSRVERALRRVAVIGVVRSNGYEAKLLRLLAEFSEDLARAMA
jgi:hypothetical protein